MRYSPERKEAVLKKMMPPHNRSISQLASEEGISEATLYNWRNEPEQKASCCLMAIPAQMAERMVSNYLLR
ncbi:hypothetical protein FCL47_21145 [Desulfopila sp. IMCC35006]|nr:hypothetical protein FCL47_21145 [Desulfopila sp. IMCC35006]